MKRAVAIIASLLLVWVQASVIAQSPARGPVPTVCACGDCAKACCCAAPSEPNSQPAPATPVRAGAENNLFVLATTSVAWTLPGNELGAIASSISSPLTTAGVPLFMRHCALLI